MEDPGIALIVDDDPHLRRFVAQALREAGIESAEAENGQEGLAYLARRPAPAVILLDLEMPVMGGAEFRRALLRNPLWSGIPVIIMTGAWIPESSLPLGVAGWVTKPLELAHLIAAVTAYCRPGK
ncbi:MAG: Transcriptional regulatory protein [Armatimonadetes bacterium]|jgi:CheY-like chemotaxis protein|nr:Transcriptional regulatory protein [Armatimonadota bacterium]